MSANRLEAGDFPAFFRAVWGVDPFPWQQRLIQHLAVGGDATCPTAAPWPAVLDLPTGAGKTAALDIAVFHLALEASKGRARRAPMRIALVVDRRLIVDDAHERAKKLADTLRAALDPAAAANPVTVKVARALAALAGQDQPPLAARRLRGGAPLEDDWARTPCQPTILCSTVDQVGSRLLFRGYGISDRMKPIHAGLLGSDCLILLDEAHLSGPFRQTLTAIRTLREPDDAPFGFVSLSATPGTDDDHPFGLDEQDRAHPALARRTAASKPARLIEMASKQGVDAETSRAGHVASTTLGILEDLTARAMGHPAVGVVLNRVTRARMVFERLRREAKDCDMLLLIGPSRPIERDAAAAERLAAIRTGAVKARGMLSRPLIVVATQTIEAGVDLDFDGLVTEAASFDALRQRFGRLNRAGRPIAPQAAILAHKSEIGAKAEDVIYGDRLAKTWAALRDLAVDGVVDFGIDALKDRISAAEARALAMRPADAPILMPAYAELWSQTSPIPSADPDVALFLHGPDLSPANVQIVWRADIAERDLLADDGSIVERLRAMPPRASESVQVSLWAARKWLDDTDRRQMDLSDSMEHEAEPTEARAGGRLAFRWAGEDGTTTGAIRGNALRDGDLIVVPSAYGGCDAWGWKPDSDDATFDIAEQAQWPFRSTRYAVRITPELIGQNLLRENPNLAETSDDGLDDIAADLSALLAEYGGARPPRLLDAVLALRRLPETMKKGLQAFSDRRGRLEATYPYGNDQQGRPRGIVFVAPAGLDASAGEDLSARPATETEEGSSTASQPIALAAHSNDVRDWAHLFTHALGLQDKIDDDVTLAAFLHDAGKADPRFQAYLAGGDPYGPDIDQVLAKTGNRRLGRDAWRKAGLPDKWRHEALSVRLALLHPGLDEAHDPELVLWLIGTHHGFGRPLFPHSDPEDAEPRTDLTRAAFGIDRILEPTPGPQSFAFDFRGQDWPQLFEQLRRRYGLWGLARLEALLRLADHRASETGRGPDGVSIEQAADD
mgnify:CR=1 FL=1